MAIWHVWPVKGGLQPAEEGALVTSTYFLGEKTAAWQASSCAFPTGGYEDERAMAAAVRTERLQLRCGEEASFELFYHPPEILEWSSTILLDRVRPGEREGRGRTGSPLRPV